MLIKDNANEKASEVENLTKDDFENLEVPSIQQLKKTPIIKNHKMRIEKRDENGNRYYRCPICDVGYIKISDNLFYGRCNNCKGTLIDYTPLPHQEAFHKSNAQYRLNIGGFGSGKTLASCAEIVAHATSTPNGKTLITAPTLALIKDAVIPELEKVLPKWYVEYSRQSPSPFYRLTNGHQIVTYSSIDQENLRSLNLTAFYIEEASGVDYSIFDQLMTRLRNKAAIIRDKDGKELHYKFMGIVSTNPEDGWIKDKFLLIADKIIGSSSIDVKSYEPIRSLNRQKHFHAFISSTRDNSFLPKEYIERTTAGKSQRWIQKYIDCVLHVREGVVYPDMPKAFVEPFPIPKNWLRVVGYDPGFSDPTARPIGAVDPKDGVIYFYDDYYVREQPVSYHARKTKEALSELSLFIPIQADPRVKNRNDRDLQTYQEYFYTLSGLILETANDDILYGIEKVRDYMYAGKIKFFNSCENFKYEMQMYRYPDLEKRNNEKPIDKDNHLMDCLRYIITALPQNPVDMNNFYLRESRKNLFTSAFVGDKLGNKKDNEELPFDENIYSRFGKNRIGGKIGKF